MVACAGEEDEGGEQPQLSLVTSVAMLTVVRFVAWGSKPATILQ